ncbi:MAG: hypothetical protein JXN61_11175 [Sedimentisphaerales bacterium]|nr:hypothetical protein [Sedimentisphaerales bacterium]
MTEVCYAFFQVNKDNIDKKDEGIRLLFDRENKLVLIGLDRNSRECDSDDYQKPAITTKPFEEINENERKAFEDKLLQIHIGDTCAQVEQILGPATSVRILQGKESYAPIRGTCVSYYLFKVNKDTVNIYDEHLRLLFDNDQILKQIHMVQPDDHKTEFPSSEPKKGSRKDAKAQSWWNIPDEGRRRRIIANCHLIIQSISFLRLGAFA